MNTKTLCENYSPLTPTQRLEKLFGEFDRVLVTSSFGTTSAILLHHLHKVKASHPVHFIDTRYHFKETHAYKNELASKWSLNVVDVRPKVNEHLFTRQDFTWAHHPDSCCYVNKVMPLDELKSTHDVWISGMLGGTTELRKKMPIFQWDGQILRFYPFINMTEEEAEWYRIIHELPSHPLEATGYASIGCTNCTVKGEGREGRWAGSNKKECGLHVIRSQA
ncbi:MAG: phosphoadenylyl-sulfate reductase [Bacteroidia bacterium]|nr:phosphoadenylyl-sulfate reductase [Bacteroidia bacterium]